MSIRMKTPLRSCVYAVLIGGILSMIALVVAVSQSGFGRPSTLATILVYLSYWPMLAAGWSSHDLFVSLWVLPANLVGWALIGFLFGLVRGRINPE